MLIKYLVLTKITLSQKYFKYPNFMAIFFQKVSSHSLYIFINNINTFSTIYFVVLNKRSIFAATLLKKISV